MNNHRFPVPLIPVTGKVLNGTNGPVLFGDLMDLAGSVSIGLYDADTNAIATGSGNGKVFYLGYSSEHTRDFLDKFFFGMQLPKGAPGWKFKGDDVISFEYSNPAKIKAEKWVLGYDGSAGCNNPIPVFECGKIYGINIMASASPIFRRWAKVLEHEIFTTTICCSDDNCTAGCIDNKVDPRRVMREIAKNVNTNYELKQIGVHARYISNQYVAPTPNMTKYQLTGIDDGDAAALAKVQASVGPNSKVVRIARVGYSSTYEICAATAPAPYQPDTAIAYSTECGICPAGYTTLPAHDVWTVIRPLAGTEDFTTANSRDTYADTVGTAYGVAADADKTFISFNGATASVHLNVPTGTVLTALSADTILFNGAVLAQCTIAAPAPVAWTVSGTAYRGERNLCITLERVECSGANKLVALQAYYANNPNIKTGSVVLVANVDNAGCRDTYNLVQYSDNCALDGCLSFDTTDFTDISYEGKAWEEVVPANVPYDATVKVGLEITAEIPEKYYSDCAFELQDFYETEPIRLEVSWIIDSLTGFPANCDMSKIPRAVRVTPGVTARQSGEWLLREYIKAGVYEAFSTDSNMPRMRDIMDSNRRKQIDRSAFYKMYYLQFNVYRKAYNFGQHPETVEAMIAFKEGDQKMFEFENLILGTLGKFGVALKERK